MDNFMQDIGSNIMMLMGFSFVLGSLFTILILLFLDFMRRDKKEGIE
tara:strand:+ start:372 stop:512 length:141 start_codon:yes stop_codon:yes gene_type:complete